MSPPDDPASSGTTRAPPPSAAVIFGDNLEKATAYRDSLATAGPIRGLNGPREIPVLWERHIINSALVGYLPERILPHGARVCDVGSGAGLPGIPLALARPDLRITLLDPLERRIIYLSEIVAELGLANVRVVRGRAEPDHVAAVSADFDVVTSRAVAPLEKLLVMCLPLLKSGGWFAALKGRSAQQEIDQLPDPTRNRVTDLKVLTMGSPDGLHMARVIVARRGAGADPRTKRLSRKRRGK